MSRLIIPILVLILVPLSSTAAGNTALPRQVLIIGEDGQIIDSSPKYEVGTIQDIIETSTENRNNELVKVTCLKIKGDLNAFKIFEFLSDNITIINNIEFSIISLGTAGTEGENYVTTSHTVASESGGRFLFDTQLKYKDTVRSFYHSHKYSLDPGWADNNFKNVLNREYKQINPNATPIIFGIYLACSQYEKERYRQF